MSEEGQLNNANDGGRENNKAKSDGGSKQPGWTAALKDDLKTHEGLSKFKTVDELARAHLDVSGKHAEASKVLEKSIQIPGEDATDEERAAFLSRLGRPEKHDDYKLKRPKLPEGLTYDEALEARFREQAHKAGLSQSAAESMFNMWNSEVLDAHKQMETFRTKQKEAAVKELKSLWGDELAGNTERAKRGLEAFAKVASPDDEGKSIMEYFDASGFGDRIPVIKLFSEIGKLVSEDGLVDGLPGYKKSNKTSDGRPMLTFPSMEK